MKVWVVSKVNWEDFEVSGVFATEELARAYVAVETPNLRGAEHFDVEEFEVQC